jgi:hypothetical protein
MSEFFKKPIKEFTDKEVLDMLDVLSEDIKRRNILMGAPGGSGPQTIADGLKMLETLIGNFDQVIPKAQQTRPGQGRPNNRRRRSPNKS